MNKIILKGRLVKDPELRYTRDEKPVCNFTIAVNDDYDREKAYFFDIVAWGKQGQTIDQHMEKGSEICLVGRMVSRDWEDRQGNKRRSWEVMLETFDFVGSKKRESEEDAPDPAPAYSALQDADGELPY